MTSNYNQNITIWLGITAMMIIGMVIIGGTTRLTDSGLSMIDWHLYKGIFPPTSHDDWIILFEKYKQYPEYKLINFDINLNDFKKIFFWEYFHRIWGRLIGLVFFIPLFYFWITKKLSTKKKKYLLLVLLLGCLQAFMGWYMVESGLVDKPDVSQYRLAAHLSLAFIIYSIVLFLFWNSFRSNHEINRIDSISPKIKRNILLCLILTFTTIITGAFVAGTNAGLAYNNFPLMGNGILPPEPFSLNPIWSNFFENISLVQFDHRVLATITSITIIFTFYIDRRKFKSSLVKNLYLFVILAIIFQYVLGIITLRLYVPISLGVIHQLGSLVVLSTIIILFSEIHIQKKSIRKNLSIKSI